MQVIEGFDTDFIPSIAEPTFETAYFGDPDDEMLVIETNDGARAYPVPILDIHHLVNDEIDGKPVLVSFCPLCGSVVAYERQLDGQTLTFEFAGKMVDNNLVMRDRETGSEWKQSSGECLQGDLEDHDLELHSARMTTWEDFHAAYPEGVVLQRPDARRPNQFQQFAQTTTALLDHPAGREVMDAVFSLIRAANLARDPESGTETVSIRPFTRFMQGAMELRGWVSDTDDAEFEYDSDVMSVFQREDTFGYLALHGGPRDWEENGPTDLTAKTRTLGIASNGEAIGFPRPRVDTADGVVHTTIDGTDVVVFATENELNAFENPGLEFEPTDDNGVFEADGVEWDGATGESDDGRALARIAGSWTYAYAWQDDHDATAFYAPEGS